jgi:hypothetical protein
MMKMTVTISVISEDVTCHFVHSAMFTFFLCRVAAGYVAAALAAGCLAIVTFSASAPKPISDMEVVSTIERQLSIHLTEIIQSKFSVMKRIRSAESRHSNCILCICSLDSTSRPASGRFSRCPLLVARDLSLWIFP